LPDDPAALLALQPSPPCVAVPDGAVGSLPPDAVARAWAETSREVTPNGCRDVRAFLAARAAVEAAGGALSSGVAQFAAEATAARARGAGAEDSDEGSSSAAEEEEEGVGDGGSIVVGGDDGDFDDPLLGLAVRALDLDVVLLALGVHL
jgi:hypothetical protein